MPKRNQNIPVNINIANLHRRDIWQCVLWLNVILFAVVYQLCIVINRFDYHTWRKTCLYNHAIRYDRSGHSRHKSHSQSVQCTRPSHCLLQQWRHNPIQLCDVTIATQRTLLRMRVNGTEIVLKSTDRRPNLSLFLYAQGLMHKCLIVFISRVIRWNCFSKI